MSEASLQNARESFDVIEKHLANLKPSADRQTAERLRDNLGTCISLAETSPRAAEVLLPSVIEAAEDYLRSVAD